MAESGRARVPRGLKEDGPAIWSYGFRPFLLGGAVWAVAAMALWIAALASGLPVGGAFGAPLWHAHEMVFGFAPAVMAGFLLTAIPNWTGGLPVSGRPLIGIFGLWVAGRVAMALSGWTGQLAAAVLDALFLPAFLALAGREIAAGRKWSDLKVLAAVAAVMAGNLGFHIAAATGGDPSLWLRAGVAGYVALVMVIGGRLIPSYTRNWMAQRKLLPLPVPYRRFDAGVIVFSAATLAGWVFAPDGRLTGVAAVVAAALNGARLARWSGLATWPEKLLFVLHVAYAFVPLGFAAIAAATAGLILPNAALHVLTVGVIGGTMLSVMARVTRAQIGMAPTASAATTAACASLFAAALARPLADLTGAFWLTESAGVLWILGFGLFVAEYGGPLLLRRRPPRGS